MNTKACSRCGEVKLFSEFYQDKAKALGIASSCKTCSNRRALAYHAANPEKYAEYIARHREKHPGARAAASVRWRQVHLGDSREDARRRATAGRKQLHDTYVKSKLTKGTTLRFSDIPPELVALKREQLAIHRLAKQLGEAINEGTDK